MATAIFRQQWQVYRKMVDNDYLSHRETSCHLHDITVHEAPQPFRFLDVACGDAGPTVEALRGTRIAHYHGIDLSGLELALARQATQALDCPVELTQCDFAEALANWHEPVDVVWIGQSLHHLQAPGKLAVMRDIRRLVGERGVLVVYEPSCRDGEDREAWLNRWERQGRRTWTALMPDELEAMVAHVRAADFPETRLRWHSLGHEAGFGRAREVFVNPGDFLRMYCFRA